MAEFEMEVSSLGEFEPAQWLANNVTA
jgi:hypothetical protein